MAAGNTLRQRAVDGIIALRSWQLRLSTHSHVSGNFLPTAHRVIAQKPVQHLPPPFHLIPTCFFFGISLRAAVAKAPPYFHLAEGLAPTTPFAVGKNEGPDIQDETPSWAI